MSILDRQRCWDFIKAYLICFTTLVGLYIVIDAFTNLDEFTEIATTPIALFKVMGRFYLMHTIAFFDRLCGVITMMAAIFTVTWMQRYNQHLAMLAAGISTHRVIRPVWMMAAVASLLAVANQEILMPKYADEIQRDHADVGVNTVGVFSREDANGIMFSGREADRRSKTILAFNADFAVFGELHEIESPQARYIPSDDLARPLRGGWVIYRAKIAPPLTDQESDAVSKILIPLHPDTLKQFPGPIPLDDKDKEKNDADPQADRGFSFNKNLDVLSVIATIRPTRSRGPFFLRSNLAFTALTQNTDWHMFATTPELVRAISDPSNGFDHAAIEVSLHLRILRPILNLALLFFTLPQVLGGYDRNMFINLGLSLASSGLFYGVLFLTQFLGNNGVFPAELAAWIPLIAFGSFAAARWDSIRT